MTFNVPALIHKAAAYITQFITYVRANGYTYKNPCETWANMNKFENATLLLEPKAYKAGSIQCTVPATAAGGLTFSRTGPATVVNEYGKIVEEATNVPRLSFQNYDCGEWLLEPARTNLLTYSEQFDNAAWLKTNFGTGSTPVVTVNQGIAPNGTMTADRVVFNLNGGVSASDQSLISQNVIVSSQATTAKSIWVKSNTNEAYILILRDGQQDSQVSKEVITSPNEWTRVTITNTVLATNSQIILGLRNLQGVVCSDYADILVWGAQLEEGGYPTSYIKTEAATVTRSAETISKTGVPDLLGDAEGTLYFEGSYFAAEPYSISIDDGTANNRVQFDPSVGGVRLLITSNGVPVVQQSNGVLPINETVKIAVTYSASGYSLWLNGSKITSGNEDASFTTDALTSLRFSAFNPGSQKFHGNVKAVAVWDTALTDAELTNLTTT